MGKNLVKVKCEHCGQRIDKKSMARHLRIYHLTDKPKEYKCEQCPQEFFLPSELNRHLEQKHKISSRSSEDYNVQKEESYNSASAVTSNEVGRARKTAKIKSDVCTIQCDQCPQICANMKVYNQHMRSKHSLKCEHCVYTTVHPKKMRFHMKKRHSKSKTKTGPKIPKIVGNDGGDKAECPDCGKLFTRRSDLRRHYDIIHRGIKNFKCSECNAAFSQITNLRSHMEKCHKNTIDGYEISNEVIDDQPYILHTNPVLDEPMDENTVQNEAISPTMMIHLPDKIPCPECGTLFARRHDLKRHVLFIHRGFKPFRCLHCPMEYSNISHLKGHSKNVHGIPDEEFDCEKLEVPDIEDEIPKVPEKPRNRNHHNQPIMISESEPMEYEEIDSVLPDNPILPMLVPLPSPEKIDTGPKIVPETVKSLNFSHISHHTLVEKNHQMVNSCVYPDCDKTFTRRSDLKRHILNVHERIKPFICKFKNCQKSFFQITDLKAHAMSIHDAENNLEGFQYEKIKLPEVKLPDDVISGFGKSSEPPKYIEPPSIEQLYKQIKHKEFPSLNPIQVQESLVQEDIQYEPTDYQSEMIEFHTMYFCAECDFKVDKLNDLLSHHTSLHEL